MADISQRITRKSLKAKKKAAIKTLKSQTKEKIKQIQLEYDKNPQIKREKIEKKEQRRERRIQRANARASYNARQPRAFSLGEDIFCSIIHGIGAGLSVTAIVLLCIKAHSISNVATFFCAIFGANLFFTYISSTLRHGIFPLPARRIFATICSASFFVLVATTFSLVAIGHAKIMGIFVLWAVCASFAVLNVVFFRNSPTLNVFFLTILFWIPTFIFAVKPIVVGDFQTWKLFLFLGTILYTMGGFCKAFRAYRWTHCFSHFLTLGASVLHFFSAYFFLDFFA